MPTLLPRVVFSSGMCSAGKSTICKEIVRRIPNALYLDRDDIIWGLLHVAPTNTHELPSFEEYVAKDDVFPKNAQRVATPFGEMIKVAPLNAFNRRHGRDQSYLVASRLAKVALDLGKVPIIDCFLTRQINDGTMRRVWNWDIWADYPKYMLHFVASEDTCWERMVQRAKYDKEARTRNRDELSSKKRFLEIFAEKQQRVPKGLEEFQHLFVDTSKRSVDECAEECIRYISWQHTPQFV